MTIKVLIADDQAMVRTGFRMILEAEPDIEIVGEADDGAQAVTTVETTRPDVVLMDIQMPVMDGLEATRRIIQMAGANPIRVLILTTFERDDYIFEALRAGASGFLIKNAPPEDMVNAVRVVAEGDAILAPSVTRRIIGEFARGPAMGPLIDQLGRLTEREIDVLKLLGRGMANSEIANTLSIGETTVKTHVSNVLAKLDLRDRIHAVVFAYESGVVKPGMG